MSSMNLRCSACGREIWSGTWVDGMYLCAICYQKMFATKQSWFNLSSNCIICGESVLLTSDESLAIQHGAPIIKVCDKCKNAIMRIRNE